MGSQKLSLGCPKKKEQNDKYTYVGTLVFMTF